MRRPVVLDVAAREKHGEEHKWRDAVGEHVGEAALDEEEG